MLYFLQLLRFIASLLVLFFHLKLVESGYKGVDIFFVISGFVMYYTLFSVKRPRALKFIINRFTKIFFLYWFAIVLLYFIMPHKPEFFTLKTILLFPGHTPVLGVSWSLSYELYFYFIIGFIVYRVPARFHKVLFAGGFIACTVITFINLTSLSFKGSMVNFLIGQNLWEFLLGILSGYFFSIKVINPASALKIAVGSFLLLMIISFPWNSPISYIVYGPLSFAIVWCITSYEKRYPVNKKLQGLIKVLGEASYGIYLFGPIITLVIVPRNTFSKFMIIFITIAFSILFNRFIESKFLKWSRRIIFNTLAYEKIKREPV
jgi:exopolysaccharide production protein ExoZ